MLVYTMMNVLETVIAEFSAAIKAVYPDFIPLKSMFGHGGKFGDYKCMAAMPISQVCQYVVCSLTT